MEVQPAFAAQFIVASDWRPINSQRTVDFASIIIRLAIWYSLLYCKFDHAYFDFGKVVNKGLLNRPPPTYSATLDVPTAAPDPTINIEPPTKDEVEAAIQRARKEKVPSICNITVELIQVGGEACTAWLTFREAWEIDKMPDDWGKGIVMPFHRGKGSPKECKNYMLFCWCLVNICLHPHG